MQVEVFVPLGDLEANAAAPVTFNDEVAIAKYAMHQVGRGGVEDDQINAASERLLETAFQRRSSGRARGRRDPSDEA